MTDTLFGWAVIASLGTHVAGLAAAAALALGHGGTPPPPIQVPIEVVRVPEEKAAPPSAPKPERRPAPKPVRRIEAREPAPIQPSKLMEDAAVLDAPAPTRLSENVPSNAMLTQPHPVVTGPREGGAAGAGALFGTGDLAVRPGGGAAGGSGAGGRSGSGLASAGASDASGAGVTSFARPLGGYQTTPRYPESARTASIEGVSLLRFVVLADGFVGTVNVEKSAGHPDLDRAAIDAVKTWRFEPARRGKEAVAVWVTIPVRFQLTHH
jgi:periplasmic protein TonB